MSKPKATIRSLEAIRAALQDRRLSRVSEATGIHRATLAEIRDNPQTNPKHSTLAAIDAYLDQA